LLDGKSNKELAETLFVSEKTIESHLANIYRKVGVKNRLELFSRLKNN
jgi:LuxR family transcriptional regulator of csgAB operon